ncbi:MAG: response regulator [Synechococcales cyanobacterium C42_A2020_086]|jgi:CheY-like chemotaxis protein/signal transduction histidine kinase/CHASE3 domain sensor protein|nr:response regulator [Synechococcales cyanobacterium C42_A2020_086]
MVSRFRIGSKIAASFALGLGIFATIAAVSYHGINELVEASLQETHTYRVLRELEELNSGFRTAEAGQRTYVITGESRYLEPYEAAAPALEQNIKRLQRLVVDNPEQQRRLDALEQLVTTRLDYMRGTIEVRRTQGFEAARARILADRGTQLTQQLTSLIEEIKTEEQGLLDQRTQAAQQATRRTVNSILFGVPLYSLLLAGIGYLLARDISKPLQDMSEAASRVGAGDLSVTLPESGRQDEIGLLTTTLNQMIANLRETTQRNDEESWLQSNLAAFTQLLQGRRNLEAVSQLILSELAPLVGAQQGVLYVLEESETEAPVLKLLSSYAYRERKHLANRFRLGEGLVGQCALEKQRILLTDVPSDYIRISSGLGEAAPTNIVVLPVLFEDQVTAVIELASFQRFSEMHLRFLEQVTQSIGVVMSTIAADARTAQLLQQSQALTEELRQRQSELESSYQQLEQQAEELRASEALLKEQQEELQQTNEELQQLNEELEEKAELLTVQKREVERKNQEIEQARQAIAEKAEQLALSSKYKSEFLANMSHELRTPLNSLLILARLLADNADGNLNDKQIEYSRTIYSAGNDLLELINDILDLAKIESGMMVVNLEVMPFSDLQLSLQRTFDEVASDKGLAFDIVLDPHLPPILETDPKRLQQILKNLLANAFKFTERGGVTLHIQAAEHRLQEDAVPVPAVAFAVTDTGIGIAAEKQKLIFEAFQQADGTTSRKYGGTGLGLSISRELAHLLGGCIELVSQPGQGSTFTLYLPVEPRRQEAAGDSAIGTANRSVGGTATAVNRTATVNSAAPPELQSVVASAMPLPHPALPDDRDTIQLDDRVLLIIEDDVNFARILMEMAHKQGFKVLVSLQGGAGLALAQEFKPNAVMLDIRLPDMDGWTVLDRLKHNAETRHIPVHILSVDEEQQRGLQLGAIAYLQKPVSAESITQALTDIKGFVERRVKRLLVIEDDPVQAQSIIELIGNGDVRSTAVYTGAEALTTLRAERFDCIVLDLGLPDMSGFELIEHIKQDQQLARLPIVVYTGKELTRQQETELRRLAETIIVKDVRSPERLLDETALFLHRIQSELPQPKQQMLEQVRQNDPVLADKKVLIIDDDVRNIFALTSLLERYQMQVVYAENGREGIAALEANPDVNVILMDVMMPEMDGYETTRAIRQQERFRSLPIIALTAKAMQGDREKCLEAGASDYITKPVDTEQLLSLLRVWLYGRS